MMMMCGSYHIIIVFFQNSQHIISLITIVPVYHTRRDNCGGENPDIFCQISGKCLKPTNTPIKNNWDQRSTAHFTQYVQADANFCNNEEDGWNGCGPSNTPDFLTDAIGGATGFESACNTHDVCYDNCYKTRQQCENDFKSDTYALFDDAVLCEFAVRC